MLSTKLFIMFVIVQKYCFILLCSILIDPVVANNSAVRIGSVKVRIIKGMRRVRAQLSGLSIKLHIFSIYVSTYTKAVQRRSVLLPTTSMKLMKPSSHQLYKIHYASANLKANASLGF